jgi:hypothetical protein
MHMHMAQFGCVKASHAPHVTACSSFGCVRLMPVAAAVKHKQDMVLTFMLCLVKKRIVDLLLPNDLLVYTTHSYMVVIANHKPEAQTRQVMMSGV